MRIGVDLGGTKIEAILLDAEGHERERRRVSTPRGDYLQIVEAIAELVEAVDPGDSRKPPVGVGIPGIISKVTGLVKNANSTELIGYPLDRDLEQRLGRPVNLDNDANCFALSEAVDGAASELTEENPIVFGVILGTGVGGGLVVGRKLLAGPDGIAGEWGHNPLPWRDAEETPGPDCWCGRKACVETFLSGPALARDHAERTGHDLSAKEICLRSSDGDPAATQSLRRYESRLARALAGLINVINPHAIVLGGGMSNADCLYENVPRLWGRYVFSDGVSTRLLKARYGDSSGVRGAAWLHPAGS